MMIEWVPWLLIVIGWTADAPQDRQVITIEVAVDEEECETMRRDYLEAEENTVSDGANTFQFLCAPVPDREAFDAAVARWQARLPNRSQPE